MASEARLGRLKIFFRDMKGKRDGRVAQKKGYVKAASWREAEKEQLGTGIRKMDCRKVYGETDGSSAGTPKMESREIVVWRNICWE